MKLDIVSALELGMISIVLSILFVNLFDTAGTLLGVATKAGIADEKGNIRNLDLALRADSTSSVAGALIGCAPVTSYVESAAGVSAGGRTGLTACTVGLLFLLATFFLLGWHGSSICYCGCPSLRGTAYDGGNAKLAMG